MEFKNQRSQKFFEEAKTHLVGGVNSPVRAYRGYNFAPPFIERADGSYIWDVDGNKYIDFIASWGVMILGHSHPKILEAARSAINKGTSFGAPTEGETELARLIKDIIPSIELIRFVSSGTEATMGAVRAARGFTGKNKIIKFDGCYHGHSDFLLVSAGSGAASFNTPDSAGVPSDFTKHTLVAKYNDVSSVRSLLEKFGDDVAAIIVEPVAANMGCVPPTPHFLKELKELCSKYNALLIFDEVITGFRVALGGAQQLYDVKADITCLGKIIGGGFPVGAYGGRRDIMKIVSPLGPVYQAGTLSGNPICMSAGLAAISFLKQNDVYGKINAATSQLVEGFKDILSKKGIPYCINRVASIFSLFFTPEPVTSLEDTKKTDRATFDKFFIHMLKNGIYFAPSPFESSFVSAAHSQCDLDKTLEVLKSF